MMTPLTLLWLPILLAAVGVFVASSLIHMVLKYHQSEYRQLPDEDKVLASLRGAKLTPGLYVFPYATHQNMKSPEIQEKQKQGPVGFLTVIPSGLPNMGKYMGLWFAFLLIVSAMTAYITGITVVPGAIFAAVFRMAATAAFMAYGVGVLPGVIWKGQPWSMTIKEFIDGAIYALITAAIFAWLWPK
ncbi:MAG: hypothetical protein WAM91_01180 [Candidatus Acidiferrales bacterium]